ncbi:L,D-transpeptidase family protein [Sphingosinicella sp. YJ22]|uniref:L,D-transpeptidase family protein n=1 Tax=Sphingosinicella sp. YJ22 TaxID=1104780 RepID=UPI001FAF82F6|nr:L,D-transpeptidase family protein [Sphingosinicella sp. YJ22]
MRLSKSWLAVATAMAVVTGGCNLVGGDSGAAPAGITAEALQGAAQDAEVRRFYEARQWQAAWNEEREQQLIETIRGAPRHGLNPATLLRDIEAAAGSRVEREVALTKAALAYAGTLAHGATDPTRLTPVYEVPRNEIDVARGLAEAVGANNVGQWIDGQAPQDEEYRALSTAYMQLVQAQQRQQSQAGATQQNVQGNAQAEEKAADDERRVEADRLPADERAVILAVNMERRRWLERRAPETRIDVNTAASFLRYLRDGSVADQRVVVVGEPGWETPQLGSPIFRLVANPTWTVPESIEQDELANLSPAQLARRNMERDGERLVQQPGPQNALGLVKFDMENDHAIYLHDTPAKQMFGRPDRHLSHGCVRVQDALGFARLIAQHEGKLDQFERALRSGERQSGAELEPTYINLERRIPVRLLYHTAYLDGGQVTFTSDAYGWDAAVAEGLGLRAPGASSEALQRARQKRAQRQQGADFGP